MKTNCRKLFTTITLLLVIGLSAFVTVPAYADGETPPVEPPVATEPIEPPTQDSAMEEAANPTAPEPAPVTMETPVKETASAVESTGSILAEIPQGTELIVLNATGESVPLATEEAAQAILEGDPMWCPAGVTPGGAGCTSPTTSFVTMLSNLTGLYGATGPGQAGVIWIDGSYDSNTHDFGVTNFTLNGSSLTNMANFAVTIQGGWTGTGKTIDTTNPSEFVGASLNILNWKNAVTLSDIAITSNTTGSSLLVTTTGNITTTRVNVSDNSGGGAYFDNEVSLGTGNVTVTTSLFNNNTNTTPGLRIDSLGTITVKDVTANGNGTGGSGYGIQLTNNNAVLPKAITLTNVTASNNRNYGILIQSIGLFTGTDLTASNNGLGLSAGSGLYINNAGGTAGVTLNGTNLFFSNFDYGLDISSKGAVKLNNINAVDNGNTGVRVDNSGGLQQPVTFTGTSSFKFNGVAGLQVISLGQITLNNITATSNLNSGGAYLTNNNGPATSGVTLTGTNLFNDNNTHGLYIDSAGAVTINNVTANGNGTGGFGDGVVINNTYGTSFKGVTFTGINTFNNNKSAGLNIVSEGIVILNNLNASSNQGNYGIFVNNTASTPAAPKAVTISGTNIINNNNYHGLYIQSHGAITTNNLTVNLNGIVGMGGSGAYLDNRVSGATTTPANVTLNGINNFNGNYYLGLEIQSLGVIKANMVTANDNINAEGASFNNNFGASTNGVTLTGTNIFTGNYSTNLTIYSNGVISLNNVTASNSVNSNGAYIYNAGASTAKAITLSGTNTFSGNWGTGLYIESKGAITLNNVTANNNGLVNLGGHGVNINNLLSPTKAGITLTGTNTFNNNYQNGLRVQTLGNIKANNITANGAVGNYEIGALFDNNDAGAIGSVTLTGTNTFIGNNGTNLYIASNNAITVSNVTANSSIQTNGAVLDNTYSGPASPKPITLSGTNTFLNNGGAGLSVDTYGAIIANNLTANGNGTTGNENGVDLDNSLGTIANPVTLTGTNTFNSNTSNGLKIRSLGAITTNDLNATANQDYGISLYNIFTGSSGNVTLSGINTSSGNTGDNIVIYASGAVVVNNVTANNSISGWGMQINNAFDSALPKPVTFMGVNTFNGNNGSGLYVVSFGVITTNNLTAHDNSTGGGVSLNNHSGTTPFDIIMNGVNSYIGNGNTGLNVSTKGNIKIASLTANENSGYGAALDNDPIGSTGNVTLTGTNTFNANTTGLYITSRGAITVNNLTANGNTAQGGASLNNSQAVTAKPVTVTGTNTFLNNWYGGMGINSAGAITVNNVTANNNGISNLNGFGLSLDNSFSGFVANVTVTGTNIFNNNYNSGLIIDTRGNISLNNVTTNGSDVGAGTFLDNSLGASTTVITLSGVNTFAENSGVGLSIDTNGTVNLTRISADGNNDQGVYITANTGNVNLTCGSMTNNTMHGLYINTSGTVTLKGLISTGNGTPDFIPVAPIFGCP